MSFGPSGGVARSLQTTEEAEGNRGGRRMGEQAGMLVACALPFDPKLIRAAHTYFLDALLQHRNKHRA